MSIKREKNLFVILGIIALIIITVIVLPHIINVNAYKPMVEDALSDSLEMDVRIKGDIKVAFLPDFRVSMEDIRVHSRGTDLCVAEEVKVDLELLPLIHNEVKIYGVGLVNPTFYVVKNKKGRFNFEESGKSTSTAIPPVKKVSITKGDIIFLDEQTKDKVMMSGIDLVLANISVEENSGQPLIQKISFNGKLNIRKLKAEDYDVSDLAFRIKARKGVFELLSISKSDARGRGKNSITADMTKNIPAFSIQYTKSRFPVEEMLQKLSKKEIVTGKIDFAVNLSMKGKSLADMKRTLNGDVSITGDSLMLQGIDIDEFLSKLDESQQFDLVDVGAYFFAGPFGPAITKGRDFAAVYSELQKEKKSTIQKLVCLWSVKNGVAEAKDVALTTNKNRIAMVGKLDFVSEQFQDVTIAVLDNKGCAVLSQKMHGSFRSPKIKKISTLEVFLGLPLSVLDMTREVLLGKKKCTVFYTGSLEHPK